MSPKIKTVVVHGATGQQGGSAVRALAAAGYTVRAAVRNPNAAIAQQLSTIPSVSLAVVNLNDVNDLITAYAGADAVYACTVPGPEELLHGKNMALASQKAGIKLHIWSTLESVVKITNGEYEVQWHDDKAAVNDYLDELGVPHTNLFLGGFMENLVNFPQELEYDEEKKTIRLMFGAYPTDLEVPLFRVTKDIGEAVKTILAHPDEFESKNVGLGDLWMTPKKMAEVIQRLTGLETHAVHDSHWSEDLPGFAGMNAFHTDPRFRMFKSTGMEVPDPLLAKHGFTAAPFEDFVTEVIVPLLKLEA